MIMKEIGKEIQIIWVEVGRKLPRYARKNITLTSKLHPNLKQTLFAESSLNLVNLNSINVNQIPQSDLTKKFTTTQKNWKFKQLYFWQCTTARFFHLYDLMSALNLENIVHLETDCVLLEPKALDLIIRTSNINLAYPLQANNIGCASIFYVRNSEALKNFLEFILDNWDNPDMDDMTLLGKYSEKEEVLVLPTHLDGDRDTPRYLFDAQSIGKFFIGTDARNCRLPLARRGIHDNRDGSVTRELLRPDLTWGISGNSHKINLKVTGSGVDLQIANLHIHSKFISQFVIVMTLFLKFCFKKKRNWLWKLGCFDISVFVERLLSLLARRVFRMKNHKEMNLR